MFVVLQYRADQSLRPIASLLSHGVAAADVGIIFGEKEPIQWSGEDVSYRLPSQCKLFACM
jgi:hypothetical protein